MKQLIKHTAFCLLTIMACGCAVAQNNASFKLPAYQKTILDNGLTLYLMEQHEVPMISLSAIIPAGAINDGNQSGIASLTALALRHGSKNMTKNQIDEALDFVGASLSTSADKEYANLSAKFASKDKAGVMNIVKEVLINPVFNAAEFTKEKQRKLVGLEQAKESPGRVIGNYFDMLYYGNSPYANPASGHASTVAKLTVADVKKFYDTHYLPNGSSIAIVGDFNTNDMKSMVTSLFGSWKKGNLPSVDIAAVTAPAQPNVLLVNKDDATETTFYIGGPGIAFSNPDKVPVNIVNTLFGGRFTSMLNDELRVNTGLTYGAGSRFVPYKQSGEFYISTFTALENTDKAIAKAVEVLNTLHEKGIADTMLQSAKNYVKGQFPPRYETSDQLADLLNDMFWYGFDESYINNFQSKVDDLNVQKANSIIQQYFPAKNLQFVLVGKASEIKKIAEKYGNVKQVNIKDDTLKL